MLGSRGVILTLAAISTLMLWFAIYEVHTWETIYKEFGSAQLPELTVVVLRSSWRFGAPIVATLMLWILAIRLPLRMWPYIVVLALILGATVFTYVAIRLPLWQLAGNIR